MIVVWRLLVVYLSVLVLINVILILKKKTQGKSSEHRKITGKAQEILS